ncbi:hypothetical protein Taro_053809 [Colocasia esculenta]|uniref:Uncharacterized protein n=1 Tax=Colocasia esculenta TaxID=4460 RepID=A0A843XNQ6_COLES|nr:hypothetical protein [Colocasia esculenta]
MCGVVSLHGSCFVEVERQLDPSSLAARLRGVRESRRIHVPPVVLVSAIVESSPRHQQSKVLTCGALGVSQMMTLHTSTGMDWSDERPGVIVMECL